MSFDIYEMITDQIIDRIESERELPWSKPWSNYQYDSGFPKNLLTHKPYRGINVWLLSSSRYSSPYWLTFRQAQQLKGNVRKGEKGTLVVYWSFFEKKEKDKSKVSSDKVPLIPFLRYYRVFNIEQCENIENPVLGKELESDSSDCLQAAEQIIQNMPNKPLITFNEARAYYSPVQDRINIPKKESFRTKSEFYATMFHELIHATGHEKRCARVKTLNEWDRFGTDPYAKEELVAEMGSLFLCNLVGIRTQVETNSVAYLQGWIKTLKNDKRLIVQAAAQAQKATDYILGVSQKDDPQDED